MPTECALDQKVLTGEVVWWPSLTDLREPIRSTK
jgi:hypothetical protein